LASSALLNLSHFALIGVQVLALSVPCVDLHSQRQNIVLIVFCATAVIKAGKQFDHAIYFEGPTNEVN